MSAAATSSVLPNPSTTNVSAAGSGASTSHTTSALSPLPSSSSSSSSANTMPVNIKTQTKPVKPRKTKSTKNTRSSKTKEAGLALNVARSVSIFKNMSGVPTRKSEKFDVALTAVLETVLMEILHETSKEAKASGHKCITVRHLGKAIHNNPALRELYPGYVPNTTFITDVAKIGSFEPEGCMPSFYPTSSMVSSSNSIASRKRKSRISSPVASPRGGSSSSPRTSAKSESMDE
jgi:hypothetical protein